MLWRVATKLRKVLGSTGAWSMLTLSIRSFDMVGWNYLHNRPGILTIAAARMYCVNSLPTASTVLERKDVLS